MGCCESREASRGPSGGYRKPHVSIKQHQKEELNIWKGIAEPIQKEHNEDDDDNKICESISTPIRSLPEDTSPEGSIYSEVKEVNSTLSESLLSDQKTETETEVLQSHHSLTPRKSVESNIDVTPEVVIELVESQLASLRSQSDVGSQIDTQRTETAPDDFVEATSLPPPEEDSERNLIKSEEASDFCLLHSVANRRSLLLSEMFEYTNLSAARESKTPLLPDAKTFGYRPCKTVPRKGKRKGRVVWRFPIKPNSDPDTCSPVETKEANDGNSGKSIPTAT